MPEVVVQSLSCTRLLSCNEGTKVQNPGASVIYIVIYRMEGTAKDV